MKDILNLKIKRRESFRPFAPSILEEHVSEWFEETDEVPFMMQVFQFREDKREQLPAVVHVDGSGNYKLYQENLILDITSLFQLLWKKLLSQFF